MSEGKKFDQGKPRISLIPSEVIEGLADVLTFGASKYNDLNWTNGIKTSRLMDATYRHLLKYQSGINVDEESGKSHLLHAMCNLTFLFWLNRHKPEFDDRWEEQKSSPKKEDKHPASCEARVENHREYAEEFIPKVYETLNSVYQPSKYLGSVLTYDFVMEGSKK